MNKIDEISIRLNDYLTNPIDNSDFRNDAPEYITYLLQEVKFWKQAADNQKDNNIKLISIIHDKGEKMRKVIKIWETATPEDDFDDIMHLVIDEIKDSLAI